MSNAYDNVAERDVTIGRVYSQFTTEINKKTDDCIPPYCDVEVTINSGFRKYTAGMHWTIRLAKAKTIASLRLNNPNNCVLCELADNEVVDDNPSAHFINGHTGPHLQIVIPVKNNEGGERNQIVLLEPHE